MIVLLTILQAVELSVWSGEDGHGQPILARVYHSGIISFAVMKSVAGSASAAEDMMNLMICAMVRTAPLR